MARGRVAKLVVLVGACVVVAGALSALFWYQGRGQAVPHPTSSGDDDPQFRFHDQQLVSGALAVILDAPAPWSPWRAPIDAGALDAGEVLFLRHPDGVYLDALAGMPHEGSGIEPTLRGIMEDKMGQYGSALGDIEWSRERLATRFEARAVAFTLHVQEGVRVRNKIWMFSSGSYWVTFGCAAPLPTFTDSGEALCRKVFDSMRPSTQR